MSKRVRNTRSRCWFFTWNNPDENLWTQLGNIFHDVEYICQLEIGENGTEHLQGCIRYANPVDKVGEEVFGLCHWGRCRNWRNAVKYCSKVATRVAGPWSNIENIKWRKTIRDPLMGKELYDWQNEIIKIIEGDPDERKVYWYWDENGCSGKTSLAKHLCLKYQSDSLYLNGCGRDVLCAVARKLENDDLRFCIFGLSRQDKSGVSYKSLEILKDGIGFSGKYESGMFICCKMHVLVFANFPPDFEMLSEDRWIVREISN